MRFDVAPSLDDWEEKLTEIKMKRKERCPQKISDLLHIFVVSNGCIYEFILVDMLCTVNAVDDNRK